jgi:UDP-N-acetylmuramoyl-tripeptide--D-alanyl-D-alanine ligase
MKARFRRWLAVLFERQVRRYIKRHRMQVVAVGGSVGKTSTRLAIATTLREKYRIQAITQLGYNSELGLPLSVFSLDVPANLANPLAWAWRLVHTEILMRARIAPQVLVLELGTDHPGEMPHYLSYIKPDIGVVTALTPEHMENFPGGLDQVAAEEMVLAAAAKTTVVNEDAVSAKYRHRYLDKHPHVIGYGAKAKTHWEKGAIALGKHKIAVEPHIIGEHMRLTLLAAAAVGYELSLTDQQIAKGIAKIRPVSGRMNTLDGINGAQLIDDTYNSSPDAVVAALETLAKTPATSRRIAILGSMNELGSDSPRYHEEAGAAAAGVDLLVTVGELANKYLGPAAVKAGLDPTRWQPADSPVAAGNYLKTILDPGDVVLAKGSQNGVFAEEALKLLLANPADASKLVRQSPSWLTRKRKQFPDLI